MLALAPLLWIERSGLRSPSQIRQSVINYRLTNSTHG